MSVDEMMQLLKDIDANMRRAWDDRSLSHNAWPTALAKRLTDAVDLSELVEMPTPADLKMAAAIEILTRHKEFIKGNRAQDLPAETVADVLDFVIAQMRKKAMP